LKNIPIISAVYGGKPGKKARGAWHWKAFNLCSHNFHHTAEGVCYKRRPPGNERRINVITLEGEKVSEAVRTEIAGAEKMKLFPDNIGILVNDFLVEHFREIFDFNFTALVEKDFDEIADGKMEWPEMIGVFTGRFMIK